MSKNDKTVAQKTAELEKLLEWFDSDDFSLEVAVDKFKQARQLADEITADLDKLKNEIEVVKQDFS